MSDTEIKQAHDRLVEVHQDIQKQFIDLEDALLDDFLGATHSRRSLHHQVRDHGDGYTLRSVPTCINELTKADELVLIVARFPLLSTDSIFDPYKNLTEIPYWQHLGLQREVELPNGQRRKFHFWVWEDVCPVHGHSKRRGGNHTWEKNRDLLLCCRPELGRLMQQERKKAIHYLTVCKEWARRQNRQLTIIADKSLPGYSTAINQLLSDRSVPLRRRNIYHKDEIIKALTP